ncbi:hypothetical protein LSH36_742g01050 [Paralvinella palmiformis]|uniref:Uncharacterized protein n=1 Tax=Paralvinella palmiformis TaxID=53620 RepID=A0AAD9J246_9ANNE|nr:hypothetical protein LSH36_742g01050 [Paralvinella palmiformis]
MSAISAFRGQFWKDLYNNLMHMLSSAKSTPRDGVSIPPMAITPPPHHNHGGQVLPQYQYNFPNMVKVTSTHNMSHQMAAHSLGTGVPGGLSVVSAPAPMASRPEITSAGSGSTRGAQPTLDTIKQGKLTTGTRVRGVPPKLKDIEVRTNHAVVFS